MVMMKNRVRCDVDGLRGPWQVSTDKAGQKAHGRDAIRVGKCRKLHRQAASERSGLDEADVMADMNRVVGRRAVGLEEGGVVRSCIDTWGRSSAQRGGAINVGGAVARRP